ncbi:SusC/RagA family TonB-linked outer membrane protein [soil metagenome]
MFKKLLTVIAMVLLTSQVAFAQSGSITGQVTDANTGEPLPGVNVLLQQLQRGDATNIDGEFEIINVPSGEYTLIVTFIGYNRYQTSVDIGETELTLDIELTPSMAALDDVVVTAFGIQRDRRALGYGVAEVTAENITDRNQTDLSRALTGQLPGVDVGATGGLTGSGTDIVIRGFSTLTGSNAPLIVVDGVRFDGGRNTTDSWFQGGGAQTTPNRLLDLDPQNIADVTVLKGLSATVLYGEQGRNGVILIETKSGSFREARQPGFEITYDQSVYATQISSRPDYQNTYGNGFDQNFGWFFSNWGPRFDSTDERLFGANFRGFDDDGTVLIRHPLSNHGPTAAAFPDLAASAYRYEAKQNPIDAFFRTGLASTSNLSISGGIDDLRVNVSYSRTGEAGFTPNNELTRNSFSVGAQYRVNERLTASTTFNMSLTDVDSPPTAAGGGSGPASANGTTSVFGDVFYTPRSIDLSMPFQNPITGGSAYYRAGNDIPHPFWTANNSGVTNQTDRYFGRTEFNFDIIDGLAISYRLGYDSYTENRSYWQNPGGVRPDFLLDGFYQTIEQQRTSWDNSVNLNLNYQLTEDFTFDGIVGAQYGTERLDRQGVESENMLVRDFFQHSNFIDQSANNTFGGDFQRLVERQTAGVFANFTLGFQDFVYLNIAGRNDWFSTLELDNRSIFYPSASLSYIMSDHLNIQNDYLTFVKIYAGVGTSAGSPDPYSTRNTLGTTARGFVNRDGNVVTRNNTSSFLGNLDLKPELHTEFELGTDLRFLDGRLGLEAMVYTRTTTDLITQAPIDPSTGFTSTFVNIGEIQNQGLEMTLRATPVARSVMWNVQANFFTSRSEVIELGEDLDRIQVGGGFTNRGNFAIPGEPFMTMLGSTIARNEEGRPLIGPTGNYIEESDIDVIGNPNPDYTLSISNTVRYRGASLSFQFDYQEGGDMFSTWISSLMARGLTTDTDIVDRNNTFILPGVSAETGQENTVQISVSDVFFDNFGFGADELRVYDMTHLRLRQVSLSYDLPVSIVERSPFERVTFSLTGDNLWLHAVNVPKGSGFDPEVNSIGGNSRGFEYFTGPAARRFGGSLRVQF